MSFPLSDFGGSGMLANLADDGFLLSELGLGQADFDQFLQADPVQQPAPIAAVPVVKLEDAAYHGGQHNMQHVQHQQPHLPQQQQQQHVQQHEQQYHQLQEQEPEIPQQQDNGHMNLPSDICSSEFAGEYDFEVFINPHHGKKSPWVYSAALNKIFICINHLFSIDFKCRYPLDDKPLFIRATPVYSQPQHSTELVTRCINHAHGAELTNKGIPQNIWNHIIRCKHRLALYYGSKPARHLNVRVPMGRPPLGTDAFQLNYQFMCKNSCGSESGMNRRPIDVVFTLEDEAGNALGRRVLSVRICSCPKRDKEKEEKDHYQKTDGDSQPVMHGKKRKMDKKLSSSETSYDTKEFRIDAPVIGRANAKAIYKMLHDMMVGEMYRNNAEHPYKKVLKEIEEKMNGPLD